MAADSYRADLAKRLRSWSGTVAGLRADLAQALNDAATELERHTPENGDAPWQRVSGYGEATVKFGGEGVCVAGVEFIWHLGPDREMYVMRVPLVPSLDGVDATGSEG